MGEFRKMRPEEKAICVENGIVPEGKVVVMKNDTCLWLRHLKTGDDISVYFGEGRKKARTETA